ncbi:hypothetical protein Kpol_530p7 [Vanderwaltozyma polyspora DSM 70294]|uniref:Phosphatidylglycerophosphatase GEP4, mitochondrial n=1 Tax=Vanderwaltozyma polyspora (strain ATCC 22028 / DSM 70294 / BCRC 21397 / CBS 2163 / NBRC 10782 / NRRL Y-8283 / UCD 57-17) TaxID=436907 RepID=A7TKY2_VANPO|nr:uncharacterized protein Kpol_530p7 [Vanderwaltozyma polyspora DSM 70294]EDO17038.1 hypothetical protein Kpol_530p7 [Vanderwaltozyma polyspora DSM 70294]
MNISATLNIFRLLYNPKLCVPQLAVPTFNQIPVPLDPSIKAIVFDKDNCFAYPHENKVWNEYSDKWEQFKKHYPPEALLIVSNSAGSSDDVGYKEALLLEESTGVSVLRHSTKKPGCQEEILNHFKSKNLIQSPEEIAIVGDRLFTDIMMANLMGSYSVWITVGVKLSSNPIIKLEKQLYQYLKPK